MIRVIKKNVEIYLYAISDIILQSLGTGVFKC